MHVIIIGAGEVGQYLAKILADESQDVYVIEEDEQLARTLAERLDAQVLHGTGVSRAMLERAGVARADLLLAVTEIDEVNMIAAMTAERMNSGCRTVARVRKQQYLFGADASAAHEYGIDLLLGPEQAVAEQVVALLEYAGPGQISRLAEGKIVLLELPVQPHSTLAYATLAEIAAELPVRSLAVAVLGEDGLRLISKPDDRFQVHEHVFILCAPGEVNAVLALLGSDMHHVRRVLLIGGGAVGLQVADALERLRFDVAVVERDRERAEHIATRLSKALVIQSDGTDPTALQTWIDEGHEAVVVLVDDDSQSLLAGLVAKHAGAKKVISRVDNQEYGSVALHYGLDALISPRRAVADAILRFVRRSHIMSTTMLGNHQGEVIDFEIDAESSPKLLDKPLGSLEVPEHCLVGVITRGGEILVPSRDGEFKLGEGDHVFAVALRDAVAKVERLFG